MTQSVLDPILDASTWIGEFCLRPNVVEDKRVVSADADEENEREDVQEREKSQAEYLMVDEVRDDDGCNDGEYS